MITLAAAAYPLSALRDWQDYVAKQETWVGEAAAQGADLLVFPEYARMELATLEGPEVATDLEASLRAVSAVSARADALMAALAERHSVHILAGSGPVFDAHLRPVNRATFFAPGGAVAAQDKQMMTRFERERWGVAPGGPLMVFETCFGRIGVLICYDVEFPLLGRALVEAGVDIILVPSCTDTLAGYWRVRVGAMARALEGQCVVVHAPTVGDADFSPAVDENVGAAAIYGPPDVGFPPTGVMVEGEMNAPGWTIARIDPKAIAKVRRSGAVFNHAHWPESVMRAQVPPGRADLP